MKKYLVPPAAFLSCTVILLALGVGHELGKSRQGNAFLARGETQSSDFSETIRLPKPDNRTIRLQSGMAEEEIVRLLGEPEGYGWDGKVFYRTNLPEKYILQYPGGVVVTVSSGWVLSVGCEQPGPGFIWREKLHLGSSIEDVLKVVGPPANTVIGGTLDFSPGVLYKEANLAGKKAGYYARPDLHVRFLFLEDKLAALYLELSSERMPGSSDTQEDPTTIKAITEVKDFQDVRFRELSQIDLSEKRDLPATLVFNRATIWPARMPAGVDPGRLLTNGMNPGLGLRQLHQSGLTGKGVNLAIIDNPLHQQHPEYVGKVAAYRDFGCAPLPSRDVYVHGAAVASLLVGNNCGAAPEARIYYAAVPSWKSDARYYADALDWILEQNAKLPPGGKIRAVSVSAAPSGPGSPFKTNTAVWDAACLRAGQAGVLVLDCTLVRGFIGPCYYDASSPEDVAKCKAGFPSKPVANRPNRSLVWVPCSRRTTAEEMVKGQFGYIYFGQGGLSWSIPYCAGTLALGWQARPELSPAKMKKLLFESALEVDGALIINPPEFIRRVRGVF